MSAGDFERLIEAIAGTITPKPVDSGVATEKLAHADLRANGPSLKLAVAALLRPRYGFAIMPEHFELKIHDEGRLYTAEANLAPLCHWPKQAKREAFGKVVRLVLPSTVPLCALVPLDVLAVGLKKLVEPMGFESTTGEKTEEFCGAAWPSRVLKGKGGNS
jgi:hypothetical protein